MAKEVEPEEIIRLIDSVYKSIIEKFNPCARQLITTGKSYLKALQGATSASNVFIETLNKIAVNAQQGTSTDIGDALINVVNVHKAIQEQHINILKAFYVDLLMPLENNLEKDTKIVQVEQKKFLQQHKANVESYCKAVTTLKKQRKKKNTSGATSKELKSLQAVEEQKNKLKTYCNQSLKNALTQERRRYGFVLERQCSIAKHWMSYHGTGKTLLENNLDDWQQIAGTRENVTLNINEIFSKNKDGNKNDLESNSVLLRKTRSMEVAGGSDNKRDDHDFNQNSLPRTKSEHNLTMNTTTTTTKTNQNHRFSALTSEELVEELLIMKAVYTYEANGKNQLNFEEGDRIALIGGRVNGWQFGENLRTKMLGWFPVTYLEKENNNHNYHQNNQLNSQYQNHNNVNNNHSNNNYHHKYNYDQTPLSTLKRGMNSKSTPEIAAEPSPTRMFGDTIQFRNTRYFQKISAADLRTSPPPALPPPIPSKSSANTGNHLNASQSFNFPKESHNLIGEKKRPAIYKAKYSGHNNSEMEPPPPQPEVDYSDEEEVIPTRVPLRQYQHSDNDTIKRPLSSLRNDDSNTSTRNSSPQNHNSYHNNNNINVNYNNNNHNNINKDNKNNNFDNINSNNYNNNNNKNHNSMGINNFSDIDLSTLKRKDNFIKRTKSFWKSKKYEENQTNNNMMSWRHEDIMNRRETENQPEEQFKMDDEYEIEIATRQDSKNSSNKENSPKQPLPVYKNTPIQHKQTHSIIQQRKKQEELNSFDNNSNRLKKIESKTITSMNFDKNHHRHYQNHHQQQKDHNSFDSDDSDNSTIKMSEINNNYQQNFDDDDSNMGMIKKPLKRREILKQYYNSNDEDDEHDFDNEILHHSINHKSKANTNPNINNNNKNIVDEDDNDDDDDDNDRDDTDDSDTDHDNETTTSDPYDCIVIDDHLVKTKMEFKTFKGENQNQKDEKKNKTNRDDHVEQKNDIMIKSSAINNYNTNNNKSNKNNVINKNNTRNSNINKINNSINSHKNISNSPSNSSSGTLLPRTKLNKSLSKENHLNKTTAMTSNEIKSSTSSLLLNDNNIKMMNNENQKNGFISKSHQEYSDDSYSKSYGPWYDLWEDKSHHVAKS